MKILILLFFLATLTSQSAMDLFASILFLLLLKAGVSLWKTKKSLKGLLSPTGFEWIWLTWFLISAASMAVNQHPASAWWAALFDFKWILSVYVLTFALKFMPLRFQELLPALLLLAFCSAYSITIWYFRYDPLDPQNDFSPWSGGVRSGGFLSNPMTFAHVYGLHFCVWSGLALTGLKWRTASVKWLIPCLLLVGAALIVSFTRGAWLGVGAGLIAMAFALSPRMGFIGSAVVLGGAVLLSQTWETFGDRALDLSRHGDERIHIWRAHWQLFVENPLLGVGPKQSPPLVAELYRLWGVSDKTQIGHAHNQYLHWLTITGTLGLAAALSFFVGMWLKTWNLFKQISQSAQRASIQEGLVLGCLGAQTMWFIGAITESNFEHSKVRYVLALIWAYVFVQSQQRAQGSKGDQS